MGTDIQRIEWTQSNRAVSALGRKLRLSHPTEDYRAATEGEDVLAIAHFQLGRFADALIAALPGN